jgi:DNA invertase Pin-like site-specific DNA recombinase
MRIGYARVSTADQNPDLQEDALQKAGCEKIFRDVASCAANCRKGLADAVAYARERDTLVVWQLDRLGRSLKHLIETVNGLAARNVGFQSLRESMDTTTSGGKLIFHVFGALAEFERELIRERTQAGLRAARARGRNGGRPPKMDVRKISMARLLMENPNATVADICDTSMYPDQRYIGTLKKLPANNGRLHTSPGIRSAPFQRMNCCPLHNGRNSLKRICRWGIERLPATTR